MSASSSESLRPRLIGYARVSRADMKEDRQTQRLKEMCERVYTEKASGAAKSRPVFENVLAGLRAGDTIVVLDLDRAFRSSLDALRTIETLQARGINLRILNMNLDLSTEFGEVVFGILAALAQFERKMLARRTKEGIDVARKKGKQIGRPRALNARQAREVRLAVSERRLSRPEAARAYGVSETTVWRVCRRAA
ncbi:recombinase family protein [Henriciella algicola]|uniref:Recombinase family protein n=1 Tax=Henriciella algicola TaxID=1608422 RepID=A0A399RKK3_9PROT|nr:recombinase family protein [Henriciella algicola]RIJ31053.1 recombinase family protein [Henriciella algicola]